LKTYAAMCPASESSYVDDFEGQQFMSNNHVQMNDEGAETLRWEKHDDRYLEKPVLKVLGCRFSETERTYNRKKKWSHKE